MTRYNKKLIGTLMTRKDLYNGTARIVKEIRSITKELRNIRIRAEKKLYIQSTI
jgi:hypothetical protein